MEKGGYDIEGRKNRFAKGQSTIAH